MSMSNWESTRNKISKVLLNDDTMIIPQTLQNMIINDVSLYPAIAKEVLQRVNSLKPIPDNKYKLLYWALVSDKPSIYNPFGQRLKN